MFENYKVFVFSLSFSEETGKIRVDFLQPLDHCVFVRNKIPFLNYDFRLSLEEGELKLFSAHQQWS